MAYHKGYIEPGSIVITPAGKQGFVFMSDFCFQKPSQVQYYVTHYSPPRPAGTLSRSAILGTLEMWKRSHLIVLWTPDQLPFRESSPFYSGDY